MTVDDRTRTRVGVDRRSFLRIAGGGAALSLLGPAGRVAAQPTITIGWLVKLGGQFITNYPEFERRHDVKFKVVTFPHTVAAMQALTAGNIDVTHLTTQHYIRAIDESFNLYKVCGLAAGVIEFEVHKGVPVGYGDWAGLKQHIARRQGEGRPFTIGAPTGSYQHLMLTWQLAHHGIDVTKDVKILNINFPEHPRVMELGQVDMVSTISLFGGSIVAGGHGKLFYYPYDAPSGVQNVAFAFRKDTIDKNPQLVQAFVDTHVALSKRIQDSPNNLIEDAISYSGLPRPILRHDLNNWGFHYKIRVNDIKGMARMMHEVGWTKQNRAGEVEKFVDWSFLKKATGLDEAQLRTYEWRPKV